MVRFKHIYPRYPRTAFLARGEQRYGCLERDPRTLAIFFGMMHLKHTHSRYPKTPLLARVVQRYEFLERHHRTHAIFLAWCVSNTPILGIQKHLRWPVVSTGMRFWNATPEPTHFFLGWCISNPPILGIRKHLSWPAVCTAMHVWSASPEPAQYFWHGPFETRRS